MEFVGVFILFLLYSVTVWWSADQTDSTGSTGLEESSVKMKDNYITVDLSSYSKEDVDRARRWPKVELHLHLDGSLSPQFIAKRAEERGIDLPAPPENLRDWLMERKLEKLKADDNKAAAGGNWPVFDFCNQFLQTRQELKEAVLDLVSRLAREGVVYAEVRLCPTLHTLEGLTEDQVVEAALAGLNSQQEVVVGLLVVALRSKSAMHGVEMARLAARHLQTNKSGPAGVVGMDVAGDEGSYPLAGPSDTMVEGVREAVRLGVQLTLHAGEWPERFGSVANLAWAVGQKGVGRVGHGIAVRSDPGLLGELASKGITVEVCLTSNIGNGFKVSSYSEHPARLLARDGVKFSLSSDNLLLSGDLRHKPSPTAELLRLVHEVGLGWPAARQSVLDGLTAAFSPAVDKDFVKKMADKMEI